VLIHGAGPILAVGVMTDVVPRDHAPADLELPVEKGVHVPDHGEGVVGDRLQRVVGHDGDHVLHAAAGRPPGLDAGNGVPALHRLAVPEKLKGAEDQRPQGQGPHHDEHDGAAPPVIGDPRRH